MFKNPLRNVFGRVVDVPDQDQRIDADLFTNQGMNKPARIGPSAAAMDTLLGMRETNNLLYPLFATKGIQFPYTPDITFGSTAEYQDFHFTHSNTPYQQFAKSLPAEIQVTGTFTCQTNDEGRYLIAALRFLRSMTMMEFGVQAARNQKAGTPPPVLRFNYLGEYMFSNIPVVVSNFSYMLMRDVDYIGIRVPGMTGTPGSPEQYQLDNAKSKGSDPGRPPNFGGKDLPVTYVPTKIDLTVLLKVQQNPSHLRKEFDLDKYKQGGLIKKGFI